MQSAADIENSCPECGAQVPHGANCQANFHALLALEWEIPGGPGERAHFLAVATYGIQHPASMGYTIQTVEGLRDAVSDVLDGSASVADIRIRTRAAASDAGRVTRRSGDAVPSWGIDRWDADVTVAVGGGIVGYQERVERWAHSVVATLRGRHASATPEADTAANTQS